jgi:hypothetical protein
MQRLRTKTHQARALEWGMIFLFILVLSWVVLNRYEAMEAQAVRTIARYEHQLLQTRIQIYRLRNGRWPADLSQALGGEPGEVLLVGRNPRRGRLVDGEGRLINPYGGPYRYHPDTGELEMPEPLASNAASD